MKKHLEACSTVTGTKFEFPLDDDKILVFISYLFWEKKLKATTVSKMLCALCMLHLTYGFPSPMLRPAIVKLVLKGKDNWDAEEARSLPTRMPITIKILKLLKVLLTLEKRYTQKQGALIWSIACLAFWGAFRVGELLPKRSRTIDPMYDLLKRDVVLKTRKVEGVSRKLLTVTLKCPKESKPGRGAVTIEVIENGTCVCPVAAYVRYRELVGSGREDSACFREPSGFAYRHAAFNKDLKTILSDKLRYGKLSGHSFRIGLASLMAAAGLSDDTIQVAGRWSSEAFKLYIKLGRVTRVRMAARLAKLVE